jgi:hypothetical protein
MQAATQFLSAAGTSAAILVVGAGAVVVSTIAVFCGSIAIVGRALREVWK